MPGKITSAGFGPTEAAHARRTDAKPGSGVAPRNGGAPAAADTVELTRSARLMSRLEQAVSDAGSVDSARVSALREAVAAGTHVVDAEAIAERMIQAERELG